MKLEKNIIRETDKAILNSTLAVLGGGVDKYLEIWLPKSQIKIEENEVEVPSWLIEAKQKEISQKIVQQWWKH